MVVVEVVVLELADVEAAAVSPQLSVLAQEHHSQIS